MLISTDGEESAGTKNLEQFDSESVENARREEERFRDENCVIIHSGGPSTS